MNGFGRAYGFPNLAADVRARELVRACLTAGQRRQFELTESFLVHFPNGEAAEISRHFRPVVLFRRLRGWFGYRRFGRLHQACIQLDGNANRYDRMLAIKLALETKGPDWFFEQFGYAIFSPGRRHPVFVGRYSGSYHLMRHLEREGLHVQ